MADSALQQTIDKVLGRTESEISEKIEAAASAARSSLDEEASALEAEYDRIVAAGAKEAEKAEKQIVGGADLEARNKRLVAVEESIGRVFDEAVLRIRSAERDDAYAGLLGSLFDEAAGVLGTSEITVYANGRDRALVERMLPKHPGSQLSAEQIDCMGGLRAVSRDGTMSFDNTLDARLERLKPLIRKEIAASFGLGD